MNLPGFTADASLYRSHGCYLACGAAYPSLMGRRGAIAPALISTDGVDCSNCVGGECAELHCFEKWTHGGGGPGGPYEGGGGGGGGGVGCTTDVQCHFGCLDRVFHPCYNACVESAGGDLGSRAFKACVARCNAAQTRCSDGCKVCH